MRSRVGAAGVAAIVSACIFGVAMDSRRGLSTRVGTTRDALGVLEQRVPLQRSGAATGALRSTGRGISANMDTEVDADVRVELVRFSSTSGSSLTWEVFERSMERVSRVLLTSARIRTRIVARRDVEVPPDQAAGLFSADTVMSWIEEAGNHEFSDSVVVGVAERRTTTDAHRASSDELGVTECFGRSLAVSIEADELARGFLDEIVLHEFGHLFGAWHSANRESSMRPRIGDYPVLELDESARAVMRASRRRTVGLGVAGLTAESVAEIRAVFMTECGVPAMHPIVRGAATTIERALINGDTQIALDVCRNSIEMVREDVGNTFGTVDEWTSYCEYLERLAGGGR